MTVVAFGHERCTCVASNLDPWTTMRLGIPLLADRVAPRCTFADEILLVTARRRRIQDRITVPLPGTTWADLAAVLAEHGVDTLVCAGISPSTRASVAALDVDVVDNVTGTVEEVLEALRAGRLEPGRARTLDAAGSRRRDPGGPVSAVDGTARAVDGTPRAAIGTPPAAGGSPRAARRGSPPPDCLACPDRPCLRSEPCPYLDIPPAVDTALEADPVTREILEAAWDVAQEDERTLCRLAELVYFALELGYRRLGVAFCEDLRDPAAILTGVLRRFFEVVPVGCRMTGEGDVPVAGCHPTRVAAYLNERGTDLNVLVGLCVGADAVLARGSLAPVTTVFVKDKSLANNPIGALYSTYYLQEI